MVKNLIRCLLVFAIATLPPTAGCRNFWKRELSGMTIVASPRA